MRPRLAPGEAHEHLWARTGPAGWEEVQLVVRLDEPVIAGSRPLTGNLLEAESFIPGSLLLGALAEAVVRAGGTAEAEFLRAFVTGGVSFPDLLPAAEAGAHFLPSLPAPRDLHTCSLRPGPAPAGHGVRSSLAPGDAGERGCPACGTTRAAKPQRLEGYLVDARGGGVLADAPWILAPALREETKIAIAPLSGRVEGESLYHRQAIPTGTLLSGTLLAAGGALEPLRRLGLLEGDEGSTSLHLGKRNGRGYGRVRLHWRTVQPERTAAARSATHARIGSLLDEGRPFPLVAAARVLLRDRLGRAIRTLSPAALGLEGEGTAAVALRPVGGFRGHVGLPRREAIALAPGSVLWLHTAGLDAEARARAAARLMELVHGAGAGERGEEGYGRFRVAPFPYTWVDWSLAAEDAAEAHPIPADLRTTAREDGKDDPLGRGRERRLLARYSGSLRGQDLGHDEWRTVARLLRARAGERHGAIVVALEEGGGEVARALAGAKAERKPRSFLRDGKGQGAWARLRSLLAEAAADQLTAEERAFRTRVLANALADATNPGKVSR